MNIVIYCIYNVREGWAEKTRAWHVNDELYQICMRNGLRSKRVSRDTFSF